MPPEEEEKVGGYDPPKEKKMKRIKNPAWLAVVRPGEGKSYQIEARTATARRQGIPEYIEVEDTSAPPPPTIEEQQTNTYENIVSTLAQYQDAENRRFIDLQTEAAARDATRTREYQTLMSDFSTKLTEAETKRTTQYTSFMSQLTKSFTDAEDIRKAEKKLLDKQLQDEKDLQFKSELEKKTLFENTTAQQIQRLRLKGSGVRKPTIKTSNVGLAMTGLIGRPQAIGM